MQLRARALVNAAGPWADQVLATTKTCATGGTKRQERAILVKGSHIAVPRLHDSDFAYILQHTDRRVIFVIPYEGKCSLIGTTDVNFHSDPAQVEISPEETQYLCAAVSEYFT